MALSDTEYKKCFDINKSNNNSVFYNNNKLAFRSGISKSGFGCISDRPSNYISSDGTGKSGLNTDGDCNDNGGENLSNEPTHILYNNDVAKLDRLRNGKKCLTYDDTKKVLNTVDATGTLDLTTGWEHTKDKHLCSYVSFSLDQCLKVNDDGSVSVETRPKRSDPTNMSFVWSKEGNELKNVKTNKCLDINNKKVIDCVGPVRHLRWEFDNGLLKNKRTKKCLDSNGSSVYTGGCSQSNPFMKWDLINNGTKIKHRSSNKCLSEKADNGKTVLYMEDCDCSDKIQVGQPSEKGYRDYLDRLDGSCKNLTNWGYDSASVNCLEMAYENNNLMNNFIKWCDSKQNNASVNKYCMEFLKYGDLIQYYSRFCTEKNNDVLKPICARIVKDNEQLMIDDTTREFIKIRWDEAMMNACNKALIFSEDNKKKNTFKWKYTTNENDSDCLVKWTYLSADGSKQLVERISSAGDTGFWCPIASGKDDPLLKCSSHIKTAILRSEGTYVTVNDIWKDLGGRTDLPIRLYKKLVLLYDKDWKGMRSYIINNFVSNGSNNIHLANFILFYAGAPVKIEDKTPTDVKYFSSNGDNYIVKTSNYDRSTSYTAQGTVEKFPDIKYNVFVKDVKYSVSPPLENLSFVDNNGSIVSIKSNGSILNHTLISSFGNPLDSIISEVSMHKYWYYILFIIAVLVFTLFKESFLNIFKKKSSVSNNQLKKD